MLWHDIHQNDTENKGGTTTHNLMTLSIMTLDIMTVSTIAL
jgi:hypothetical protein